MESVLLGILGICFVSGLLISWFFIKNGYNKIELGDINLFDWVMIIFAVIAIICVIYDLLNVQMDRMKFGAIEEYIKNDKSRAPKIVSLNIIFISG